MQRFNLMQMFRFNTHINLDLSPVMDDMFFWKNCLMITQGNYNICLIDFAHFNFIMNSRRRYSSCGLYDTTIILFRWIHHPASQYTGISIIRVIIIMHPLLYSKKVINLMAYLPAYDCNHLQDSVGAVFLGRAWNSLHYVDGTLAAQLVNLMGNVNYTGLLCLWPNNLIFQIRVTANANL
ncbi:hypothetical protein ACJX0J_032084 [Zea mays]